MEKPTLYNKTYKFLALIPIILLILSLIFLFSFYSKTGDIIKKDITLTGGTSITVTEKANIEDLKTKLSEKFQDFTIREISNLGTGEQIAFIVEVNAEPDQIKPILEDFLGKELNDENSSIEFTGSSLSEGFYKQLRLALILAFLLMSVVVFIIFRKLTPALSIVLAALSDIIMTLTLVNILGISLSSAGIIAFLMLIGYSVDSNILLTTRVVREKHDRLNKRIFSAFKTGITMTLTSIAAVVVSLIIIFNFSNILRQIFTILTIGLCFDLINTWILNAGILKFYMKKEE